MRCVVVLTAAVRSRGRGGPNAVAELSGLLLLWCVISAAASSFSSRESLYRTIGVTSDTRTLAQD
eukprot:56344-Eustigmatos_ZCMA.PRE.1